MLYYTSLYDAALCKETREEKIQINGHINCYCSKRDARVRILRQLVGLKITELKASINIEDAIEDIS